MLVQDFFNLLKENKVNCFCGVPDSLLKDFCAYITDNTDKFQHTITANEGNAIALASGHYLATSNPALVYMQNSGLGNCINPLLSLTDSEVYNIPVLMLIGWRGEPDKKDEPQHIKQGKVTDKLLETIGIKYEILPENFEEATLAVNKAFTYMRETKRPFAFIVKKGTFEKYNLINKTSDCSNFNREEAIKTVLSNLNLSDIVVSTTGHISREVYETRERLNQSHRQDFLTVGSMGHASSIALGIALEKPDRNIYCFDGDGAFLMHEGASAIIASKDLKNFKHIVFNNQAHDSVGAQPTAIEFANLNQIAFNSGYKKVYSVSSKEDLEQILPEFIKNDCTSFLEIKVKCGARSDLGRPKEKPQENKKVFMENLKQVDFCYRGAIENLSEIIKEENSSKALIFTGKKSFENIKPIIETQLKGIEISYYNSFSTNPKKEEIDKAIEVIDKDFDIIISVGGGSVIDFSKAYKYYTASKSKLIAIPTTSGTGSEATQFAVVYIEGKKTSLDNPSILPNYAIIDSMFIENNPKYLKACTVMDAYCQAIESFWAVNSTEESREFAKKAIELLKEYTIEYVNSNNSDISEKIALASNLAGKAINISRTTASHAISYKITSEYNIPHGHAVSLTIGKLFEQNLNISSDNLNDKRGLEFVQSTMNKLSNLISEKPAEYFNNLLSSIGLETGFDKLGIKNLDLIINSVNIERLSNNPKRLSTDDLKLLLK